LSLGDGVTPHEELRDSHFMLRAFAIDTLGFIVGGAHCEGAAGDEEHLEGQGVAEAFEGFGVVAGGGGDAAEGEGHREVRIQELGARS
jgi:hypothetical protein